MFNRLEKHEEAYRYGNFVRGGPAEKLEISIQHNIIMKSTSFTTMHTCKIWSLAIVAIVKWIFKHNHQIDAKCKIEVR
jgi:hypothetical protein